jgi:hypothetical protein
MKTNGRNTNMLARLLYLAFVALCVAFLLTMACSHHTRPLCDDSPSNKDSIYDPAKGLCDPRS